MTTIILTIIGILLAAAAALMVIFYGGDAFNSGTIGAQAATFQNAGTNVLSAITYYRNEQGVLPSSITSLTENGLSGKPPLDAIPDLPGVSTSDQSVVGTRYLVNNVPAEVCKRINKNLKVSVTPTAPVSTPVMGCALASASATTGTFFANS